MNYGGGQGYDEYAQMASMQMMMSVMKTCFKDCINDFSKGELS